MNIKKNKMNILIAGASGSVGEGLTEAFLKNGHYITAVVRNEEKREKLEEYIKRYASKYFPAFKTIINAFDSEQNTTNLTHELSNEAWDIVVASLGGWYHGEALHRVPLNDWNNIIQNGLTSHFLFAKAILPLLEKQRNGMYVMINGGASEYAVQHSGGISAVAAAQKMMGQVWHQELSDKNVQVYGIGAFDLIKTRERLNMKNLWLGTEEIAQYILDLSKQSGERTRQYWHKLSSLDDLLL